MQLYELTPKGEALARNPRNPRTPGWGVVYFLSRRGHATKELIYDNVDGAHGGTLAKLGIKGVIRSV